jgi:hypothetical protein
MKDVTITMEVLMRHMQAEEVMKAALEEIARDAWHNSALAASKALQRYWDIMLKPEDTR